MAIGRILTALILTGAGWTLLWGGRNVLLHAAARGAPDANNTLHDRRVGHATRFAGWLVFVTGLSLLVS